MNTLDVERMNMLDVERMNTLDVERMNTLGIFFFFFLNSLSADMYDYMMRAHSCISTNHTTSSPAN